MLSAAICALVFSANAKDVENSENVENSAKDSFSSVYAGLGFGGNFASNAKNKSEDPITNQLIDPDNDWGKGISKNRFMGSFVIGAGKQFRNNIYVGGEFLADYSKTVSFKDTHSALKLTSGGFVPQLNFKLGYVFKNNILAYGKAGFAWRKSSFVFRDNHNNINKSKRSTSFVLGAGVEKIFCKKFSAALETDYDFGYNWKEDINFSYGTINYNMKKIGRSWNVRALVKYNIKY